MITSVKLHVGVGADWPYIPSYDPNGMWGGCGSDITEYIASQSL